MAAIKTNDKDKPKEEEEIVLIEGHSLLTLIYAKRMAEWQGNGRY